MNASPPVADRLREVFRPTPRGVVGLVDDLLDLARVLPVRLFYQDDRSQVGLAGADAVVVPLPKTVFRAVLARVAALCNERVPNSVTPYRGEGELVDPADPHAVFRAAFVNTPDEQRLELRPAERPAARSTPGGRHAGPAAEL